MSRLRTETYSIYKGKVKDRLSIRERVPGKEGQFKDSPGHPRGLASHESTLTIVPARWCSARLC